MDLDKIADLTRFFKALSDETRLQLVILLTQQAPDNAMCVSRLARELDTTVANVSQHLRVLKSLDLIYGERRRYRIHYFLNSDRLNDYTALTRELLGDQFLAEEIA